MKAAIISDIHGNLPFLESALKLIDGRKDIEKLIFLGDVVGYGPWSNECVEIVENFKNTIKILGNHEEYFLNAKCNSKNKLTELFFQHSFKNFNQFSKIKNYKKSITYKSIKFTHTINDKYVFEDSQISLNQNLVLGHSHSQFKKKLGSFWIMNPGSLGQNRKNINLMQFAILNFENHEVEFFSQQENINSLINEMKARKYPESCLEYYQRKIK
jgi:putative phosphoesterase